MRKWEVFITRENPLLDRYLRILGYANVFDQSDPTKVNDLLVVSKNLLGTQYIPLLDNARRRRAILEEYRKLGLPFLLDRWDKDLLHLLETAEKVASTNDYEDFKAFLEQYFVSRAIVMFSFDLGESLDPDREASEIEVIGKYFDNTERKSTEAWDIVAKYLKYVSRSKRINYEELVNYTPEEFENVALSGIAVPKDTISSRIKKFVLLLRDHRIQLFIGKEADRIEEEELGENKIDSAENINGIVANPGRTHGSVRIVNMEKDISKMVEGEILVSVMTTPRLLRAVKKAKAIVTDEGGIICHAAITAREFKVPCIVGTKIATKVLKDGDSVEVDADRGIVRKLPQSN